MTGLVVACRFLAHAVLAIIAGRMVLVMPRGRRAAGLALVAALLIAAQIAAAALIAAPGAGALAPRPIWILATRTWSGEMLAARLVLTLMLAGAVISGKRLAGVLLALDLVLIPFSGHGATAAPASLSLAIHGVHVAAALAWMGGVFGLAAMPDAQLAGALRRFSPIATGLVAVAIISGAGAAFLQAGSFPALLGTAYGQLLLVKSVALLAISLCCAGWLRWRVLPQPDRLPPRIVLAVEALAGLAMIALAAALSQSVPARHDDIVWPLPFRINLALMWPAGEFAWPISIQLLLGGAIVVAAAILAVLRQSAAAALIAVLGLGIGSVGLAGLVTAAYPVTFAASPSSYGAEQLFNARHVYDAQCTECHGRSGQGDGPAMVLAGAQAADLTAAHTAEHTAGDMYWWITKGRAGTVMDGAEAETSVEDRWDLVNFVRLLTFSARSAELSPEISPMQPFLPSIDFAFTGNDGQPHSLREFEGRQPVLLVLAREAGSMGRYEQIIADASELAAAGLMTIVICGPEARDLLPDRSPVPGVVVVKAGTEPILAAWSYYRRTRIAPDPDDLNPVVGHMEFLIDRFGYVRARFRSDEGLFPAIAQILAEARALAAEPKLLPGPEEHGH